MSADAPRFELPNRASPCSMIPPSNLGIDELLAPTRPRSLRDDEATARAIEAFEQLRTRQFPPSCSDAKFLLLEDDLDSAGFGWTARMLASVLTIAKRQGRVLLEMPLNASWQHNRKAHSRWHKKSGVADPGGKRPRWCDRAPWTLQCFYQPWTQCPPPSSSTRVFKPGVESDDPLIKVFKSSRYRMATHVQLKLSWIATSGSTWGAALVGKETKSKDRAHTKELFAIGMAEMQAAFDASIHLLYRPRPWVERLIDCVTASATPPSHGMPTRSNIIAVHIRASVEKAVEVAGRNRGTELPSVAAYFQLARGIAMQLSQPRLLVQTSSPSALRDFTRRADADGLELTFTNNTRSEHDNWGGWSPSGQMESTIVAAVNLRVASAAAVFISMKQSAWTGLVGAQGKWGARHSICCAPNATALSWWRACRRTATLYVYVRDAASLNISRALATVPASERRCLEWRQYHNYADVQRNGPWPALS